MTRALRLALTLAVTAAIALGVAVGLGHAAPPAGVAAPRPAAPAQALPGAPRAEAPAAPAPAAPQDEPMQLAALADAAVAGVPGDAVAFKGFGTPDRGAGDDYRLDQLRIIDTVVRNVYNNYVDPSRIDPRAMLVGALDAVERMVAEVIVKGDAKSERLELTVGTATRVIDLKDVETIWKARVELGESLGFVQQHLLSKPDLREVEYAAANGMLSTLDPHSILLEPRSYKDMMTKTRGEFGGLGFVITVREGNLTVVKVLKGTPAQRAGIKARDVITRIEEQSTVNMDVQDAVDRIRGKPDTKVTLTVLRAGWTEPRKIPVTRAIISVETIPQAKLLDGGVGYVRMSEFSRNCARDLRQAIEAQAAQNGGALRGLILDLRGNPGGLLEEAVETSDLFLDHGVIVRTVSNRQKVREEKEATRHRDDITQLPLVVLVNNGSASASEILAGALKNNGRALIVGRQTFGKGSVQTLVPFSEPGRPTEEAALKLTIAQYLTPGDVSIQEIGITPDVLLLPGRALKDQVNVFAPPRSMGEVDLDRHLTNFNGSAGAPEQKKRVEKAALELRYLLDEQEDQVAKALKRDAAREAAHDEAQLTAEQLEDEGIDADPDQVKEDFQIRFARELLVRAPAPDRARLLEGATALVKERRGEEEVRLASRLSQLGLDWSTGPASGTPRAVVTVAPSPGRPQRAGETATWTVTVENKGDGPFRRLHAWTTCEKNALLDRREFVFGTIRPGERRSWSVPVKLPRSMDSRRDEVVIHFEEDHGKAPADVTTAFDVVEAPRPAFAFAVQVDDRKGGNGDGLPQRGEAFTLTVDVKNVGQGASSERTVVSVKNLGDEKLFIVKGRTVLGALKPGEQKSAAMELELRRGSKSETMPFRLVVLDEKTGELLAEKVELPVAAPADAVPAEKGAVKVQVAEAVVRGGASPTAPPVAVARKGAVLPVTGKLSGFRRVEWEKGRFGFVAAGDVTPARGARHGTITEAWQRESPRITIAPDPGKGAPVVDGATLRITGSASVPAALDPSSGLRDVFIFVNDKKVFFRLPEQGPTSSTLDFAADLPLDPGQNVVTVIAREDDDLQAHRSMVVFRRGAPPVAEGSGAARPGP